MPCPSRHVLWPTLQNLSCARPPHAWKAAALAIVGMGWSRKRQVGGTVSVATEGGGGLGWATGGGYDVCQPHGATGTRHGSCRVCKAAMPAHGTGCAGWVDMAPPAGRVHRSTSLHRSHLEIDANQTSKKVTRIRTFGVSPFGSQDPKAFHFLFLGANPQTPFHRTLRPDRASGCSIRARTCFPGGNQSSRFPQEQLCPRTLSVAFCGLPSRDERWRNLVEQPRTQTHTAVFKMANTPLGRTT